MKHFVEVYERVNLPEKGNPGLYPLLLKMGLPQRTLQSLIMLQNGQTLDYYFV